MKCFLKQSPSAGTIYKKSMRVALSPSFIEETAEFMKIKPMDEETQMIRHALYSTRAVKLSFCKYDSRILDIPVNKGT